MISTAAFAAPIPLSPRGELFSDPIFTAAGNEIIGWYYGADADYASEIFVIVDPGGANYVGEGVFYRERSDEVAPGSGPQVLFDSVRDAGGADITGMTLVFGLRVWLDGSRTGNEAPDYVLYSLHGLHNPPLDAGVRAYSVPWADNTTGNTIPGSSVVINPTPNTFYVGFEDQLNSIPPDFDYNDHQFIFQGLTAHTVPEPGTWAMMFTGLGGLALGVWRRRRASQA